MVVAKVNYIYILQLYPISQNPLQHLCYILYDQVRPGAWSIGWTGDMWSQFLQVKSFGWE